MIEYRSDTNKATAFGGGTVGTIEVVSLGIPVPNMKVIGKEIDPEATVQDILEDILPVPDITFLDMVEAVKAFGGSYPHVSAEQKQMWDALVYINQHPELLEPFVRKVTAPDGTYAVVGAVVTLDGVPANRYGFVPCAEPFTYAQWDTADIPEDEHAGPHNKRVKDE